MTAASPGPVPPAHMPGLGTACDGRHAPGPCPGPVPPVTPGQAAYEAWRGADQAFAGQLSWSGLRDSDRARWEAIAQAAADNSTAWRIAARELERERDEAIDMLGVAVQALRQIAGDGTGDADTARSALGIIDRGLPGELRWDLVPLDAQPAPELAAARDASDLEVAAIIAERNQLRIALRRLADDGNLDARDRLAAIQPELTAAASGTAPEPAAAMAAPVTPGHAADARLRDLRLRLANATRDLEEMAAAFDDLTGQLAEARAELAKAERERDSLARRCAVRFDEAQKLRALVAETRAGVVLYGADEDPCERAAAARDDREALVRDARKDPF